MDIETRLRIFWAGKKPNTRFATEMYIKSIAKCMWKTQEEVCSIFDIKYTERLRHILRALEEDPILMKYYFGEKYNPELRITANKTCNPRNNEINRRNRFIKSLSKVS